jgi:hypothetical protein
VAIFQMPDRVPFGADGRHTNRPHPKSSRRLRKCGFIRIALGFIA